MWLLTTRSRDYGSRCPNTLLHDEKGLGIRKSGHVETNKFSYVGKVNATLRLCSIFLRVADYFFESAESAFDLGAKTLAVRALAAADLGQL